MQHPVTDQEARRFAKALAQLFRSPLKVLGAEGFDKPVTIADAVRLGGTLIASINLATGDPILKEKTAAPESCSGRRSCPIPASPPPPPTWSMDGSTW